MVESPESFQSRVFRYVPWKEWLKLVLEEIQTKFLSVKLTVTFTKIRSSRVPLLNGIISIMTLGTLKVIPCSVLVSLNSLGHLQIAFTTARILMGVKLVTRLRIGLSHLREYKFKHSFQDTLNPPTSNPPPSFYSNVPLILTKDAPL